MHDLAGKLRTFVVVAEQGSFSAAARALGIANSSASRQVALLEDYFGGALLIRNTRQVRLSPLGEDVLRRGKDVIFSLDNLKEDINFYQGKVSGVLRISAPWRYARLYLTPLLAEFLALYPDLKVELISTDEWVDLVKEGFDVAIRLGRLKDSSMVARKLGEQRFVVAAAPSYLQKHGAITNHHDLAQHQTLSFAYASASYTWKFKKANEIHQISTRDSQLVSNNADVIMQAAIDGAGVVIQPRWAICEYIDSGKLTLLLRNYEVTSALFHSGIYALYSKENRASPKIRAWIDFLSQRISHEYIDPE